jgi:transcription initiation factor TFIIB
MECPGCGKAGIVADMVNGEYYCPRCGLLDDVMFDYSLPWYKEDGPGYSRVSSSLFNRGLGSAPPMNLKAYKRLKAKHMIDDAASPLERNFEKIIPILKLIWCRLRIPQYMREESAKLYRDCITKGLTNGRDSYAMSLAVVNTVCERYSIEKRIDNITAEFECKAIDVSNYMKTIQKTIYKTLSESNVLDHINNCIRILEISDNIGLTAKELEKEIINKRLELGKHPAVVAGAIIYNASLNAGNELDRIKIAKVLKVSERSIRRVHRSIFTGQQFR